MKKNILIIALVIYALTGPANKPATGYLDYQIECTNDSIYLFDYGLKVGSIPYDSSKFVNLILNDNQ